MKRPINLFFLLLIMTTLAISCTKDSDIGEGGRHSSSSSDSLLRGEELYNHVAGELYDYLYNHDGATIEDIQEQLEKYSTLVTSEVRNNILYLKIDSLYDFMCDPYQVTGELEPKSNDDSLEDFENIEREIQEALYPNISRINPTRTENSEALARASGGSNNLLDKKQVMIWNPWKLSNVKDIMKADVKDINGLKIKSFYFEGLSDLKKMNQYDIVFLCCHGDPDGNIWIPWVNADPSNQEIIKNSALFGSGSITIEGRSVTIEELRSYIPSDLSKTVLWTAICFGDCSFLKNIAIGRGCPAFSGADNYCDVGLPDNFFGLFVAMSYYGGSVRDAADYALPQNYIGGQRYYNKVNRNRGNHFSVPYSNIMGNIVVNRTDLIDLDNYEYVKDISDKRVEIRIPISGNYNFHCYNTLLAGGIRVEVMSSEDNQTHAAITGPNGWLTSEITTRNFSQTRSSFNGIPGGFWIRNKKTKDVSEIPFSNSKVKIYETEYTPSYFPQNDEHKMIARVEVLGNTDDLDEGTYEYKTYLEIDGKKEYSEETYEFEVKRINKVVPEWLLEMMEPYIPIYEGDNPPIIEGTYLLSPQKLFYDSSKQYSSGRVFADNYLFFTDQDEVKDTINFVGFEVNSYGDIISEKYGEGAFISGDGNNFSIFFDTYGENHYNDGDTYSQTALIVSGTKTSTGISDIYYAFAMVDKYDPNNHLMAIGTFRVFIDGDGMTEYIDLTNSARTRTGSNTNNQIPLLSIEADNDHCFTFQRSVPFYEWKNRMDKLKRIRIINGKKVKK